MESEFYYCAALMDFSIKLKANNKIPVFFFWLDVKNRTVVNNRKNHYLCVLIIAGN